jgi:catechol 2,3-dioxygenase-like lactoylglutathione lyase family enzyme
MTPLAFDHVQITVPPDREVESVAFYEQVLGLRRIEKPTPRGAWFQLGPVQIHLGVEASATVDGAAASKRHVCLRATDLAEAERALRAAGVEILPDEQPQPGVRRFYVRDPGGNRLEISAEGPR